MAALPALNSSPGTSEDRPPRTLILCFDGTSNQFDGDNTNVVKFYALLRKDDDFDQQLCYYQPGIGTYFNPGVVSPLFQWCAKMLDEAFAWYLDEHVRGGYQFLMQNYMAGDKICIFGFSRGAYTARALAGMLHKIGLLPKDNPEQIPFAYKLYKKTDTESLALAAGFKETFCRDVKIEFVGVWETVSSVGVIMGRTLPFTTSNTTIKTFRHALSLDEHRVRFLPNLYHRPVPGSDSGSKAVNNKAGFEKLSSSPDTSTKVKGKTAVEHPTAATKRHTKRQQSLGSFLRRWPSKSRKDAANMQLPHVKPGSTDLEAGPDGAPSGSSASSSSSVDQLDDEIEGGTDVLEVWFAGCHSDVGGGSVTDDTKLSLSDITLRWMVRQVVLAQCGIVFDAAALERANIPESIFTGVGMRIPFTTMISPGHILPAASEQSSADSGSGSGSGSGSTPGSAPTTVDADALQPIYDQLTITRSWWLLEIVPTSYTCQDASGNWVTKWWIHLGRGREIVDPAPKFHVTVQQRMQDADLKYTPRAKWTAGSETYVQ